MKTVVLGLLVMLWAGLASGQTLYTFNGGGTTGSWTDANVWTTDPTGSTSVSPRVPTSADNVVVTNSFVLNLGTALAAAQTPASITVQRGGVLDLTTSASAFGATLNRLAGQGTLRIGRAYFPAVTTNDFDDANTGTVEYYNWPAGTTDLPTAVAQYNNLRFVNSTGTLTTTGTAYTVQMGSNITVNGNLTLLNTNYVKPDPSASPANPGNLGGNVTLLLGKVGTATPRTLAVQGNVTVGGGTNLGVAAVSLPQPTPTTANPAPTPNAHILNVSGSFTNNGTVNLHNGTANDAQTAALTFTGTTDASFACNGPTDLGLLKVDKGIDSQVLLNVTSSVNPQNANGNLRLNNVSEGDILVLVNGVVKLNNNIVLTRIHNGATGDTFFGIGTPATSPTLWIAGATVTNDNANSLVVYGTYRISSGKLSSVTYDAMVIREDGQVLIEGGLTTVDKFRPSNTSSSHRGSFIITGGTFEALGTAPSAFPSTYAARFSIPYNTQSFRMTGGTIRVQNPDNASGVFHIGVNPNNAIVTGGKVEVILTNTSTAASILTTAPLWDLSITKNSASGTSKAVLADITARFPTEAVTAAKPLTVLNNFSIGSTNAATFDANSQNVNIQGNFTIAANGTYLPTTNTTTFGGAQNQLLTNNGAIGASANTFYNWVIDKPAGTLTLGGTATTFTVAAAGTLSLLNGVLNDGGKTVNVLGNMVNSASHTSGGGSGRIALAGTGNQTVSGNDMGVFGNLSVGTRTSGTVAMTANMAITSQLTLSYVLDIGANRLSLTNVNTNAIVSAGFSTTCMIRTAGNQSDLGLQKTYGGPQSFTFPVGTGTGTAARYAPATIALNLATSLLRYGQVSVSPTSRRNPFVTSNNSLPYYWKVRSNGFGPIPNGSVTETFRMTDADVTGNRSLYIPAYYQANNVVWVKINDVNKVQNLGTVSDIAFEGLGQFEGEFTAGEPGAFGAVTAYYSRTNGNWNSAATWSTTGFTGNAASTPPGANNPVFIGSASANIYHTVTVTAGNATSNPVVAGATSGSLVIDKGSTLDIGVTTNHNFGALPDGKVGGSGRLRVSSNGSTANFFPGGDFGSFLQENGGTVEYYTTGTTNFTLPTASGTLSLNSYRNLWLNAGVTSGTNRTITLPNLNLRVFAQLKTGVTNIYNGVTTTFPGIVLMSNAANGNLRVDSLIAVQAGTFRYANGVARTVTADTDVRVDAGATFDVSPTGTTVTNALTVGGSITNNGVLDLNVNAAGTSQATLTFTGDQNASLTGTTGTLTELYNLTLNKGQGQAATLNLDVAGTLTTPTSNWLNLVNGTLRYARGAGSTLTIHNADSPYLIPDNAGLTVDAVGADVTVATTVTAPATGASAAADLKLAGQLQVLRGKLSVGTTTGLGNDLEYASAGAPTIRVGAGGTLYVNGQIRRTTANTNGSLRYDQSGGTVEIGGARAEVYQNNERGLLEVQGPGSIFRMTGGTLALRGTNTRPTIIADLYLRPDSTVVTAGTVALGTLTSGNITVSVESLVPLYDMRVENGLNATSTNTGLLTGLNPLSLKGSLTISNDNAYFNANGLGLNIDQDLINNNSSTNTGLTNGGFRPGTATQTTTFTGKGPAMQNLTSSTANLTVFGSLMVNNAQTNGTLLLGRNARVIGTLTIAKGTLADNGQTLTALGDVYNTALHTSLPGGSLTLAGTTSQSIGGNDRGRFGNVVLNNATGATTTANQEITGVLTLTSGVLTIGSNLLWLSNPAAGAIAGNVGATNFIRTNGIVADLGVRKSYPVGASNFTFPIGAANKYTPVQMNVTSNGAVGALTVQPIDLAHPSTTDAAAKELSFHWKVRSTGFSAPVVTQTFTYIDNGSGNDVNGTESLYKLGRFFNGAWVPQGGVVASVANPTANTLTNTAATYFDGDYTGGESSEFGTVPTFYSRTATAGAGGATWTDVQAWTFTADGSGTSAGAVPTLANPVVILPGHVINAGSGGRGAASLVLNGVLDLGTNLANNFSTVTGTGKLRIGSAIFPAGNYANFVAAGTGSVEFTGAVQLPARDTYNNLTFSGGNTKQLSNLDLTINGALTVELGTSVTNPTSQAITLTSATSGATINSGGTLNLNDGTLTTGAFLTNNGTLVLGTGEVNIGTFLANGGMLNNGNGALNVGTTFANSGTYKANVGTGDLTVGTTFTNSGTYNAGLGKLLVNTNFSNAPGGNFNAANGDVTALGNFTNAGNYYGYGNTVRVTGDFSNLSSGYFSADASTMVLRGHFTNNAGDNFDAGTGLVMFILDNHRLLTGATTFNNVLKMGPSSLTLAPNSNVIINNILDLRSGLISTSTSNILTLANTLNQPIINAGPEAYVNGRLAIALPNEAASIRTFPVGAGSRYRPVTIKPQGVSAAPVVLVEIINGSPAGNIDATLSNLSANRYYRIQRLSGTINQPTVQLSFNTDVVDEQVNVPGNLRVAQAGGPITSATSWSTAGGGGVFSPESPRGYTISAPTTIDGNSFFAVASTNKVDNPLTGAAPLPVELVQFNAARQGSAVAVTWATSSERNSAYFEVQRSADSRTFSSIERVEAKGNSNVRRAYATLDAQPLSGVSYYRLRQVDRDGKEAYSPVVAVRFDGNGPAAPALAAYPNPASGQGFQLVATNLGATGGTVRMFDNTGRLVLTQVAATGSAETTIQPSRPLAAGLYFVTLQTADGLKLTTKVTVE